MGTENQPKEPTAGTAAPPDAGQNQGATELEPEVQSALAKEIIQEALAAEEQQQAAAQAEAGGTQAQAQAPVDLDAIAEALARKLEPVISSTVRSRESSTETEDESLDDLFDLLPEEKESSKDMKELEQRLAKIEQGVNQLQDTQTWATLRQTFGDKEVARLYPVMSQILQTEGCENLPLFTVFLIASGVDRWANPNAAASLPEDTKRKIAAEYIREKAKRITGQSPSIGQGAAEGRPIPKSKQPLPGSAGEMYQLLQEAKAKLGMR